MNGDNHDILRAINQAQAWFFAYKIAPVWAKPNLEGQAVNSREGEVSSCDSDMICKGPGSEFWPQTSVRFYSKYRATGITDEEGFEKFLPDPEATKVLAAQIGQPFSVVISRGLLEGEGGDFLVKSAADEKVDFPEVVWIVGSELFESTYRRLGAVM